MRYVGFAIAVSLFIFFFAAVIIFTTNYFSRYSGLTKTSELRPVAESLFNVLLKRKGIPEDWSSNYSISPVKVGLMQDLYMVPIVVRETNGSARTTEPVTVRVTFDEKCQNKSWNTTVRLYDEDGNELNIEMSNTTSCTSQFLNVSNITWDVNISANQVKNYYLYYSPDENVTDPVYTALVYNTSSWIPSDRDAWTDTTAVWREKGEVLQSDKITNDTTNKIRGDSSVNITGKGLDYTPQSRIYGATNDWYIDMWLYNNDTSGLGTIYIAAYSGSASTLGVLLDNISANMTSKTWYNFVKQLDPNLWEIEAGFDASNGIASVQFYHEPYLNRTVKIDGLHFKKKTLSVKAFPEEHIEAISYNKFDTMRNLSYDELKKTIGESYKLSVQIDTETYGGQVNQSADAVCYENPSIIQYSNGTVKKIIPKLCIWK